MDRKSTPIGSRKETEGQVSKGDKKVSNPLISAESLKKPVKAAKKPRKAIRKVSKSMARKLAVYQKLKKEYMRYQPRCEMPGCGAIATDLHHVKRRGKYLCDVSTFRSLCRLHHSFIHNNPEWAFRSGWLKR